MDRVARAVDRIIEIAEGSVGVSLSDWDKIRLQKEVTQHLNDLFQYFKEEKLHKIAQSDTISDDYFREKLVSLKSFALMSIGIEGKLSYSEEKIIENVQHFAYHIQSMAQSDR